MILYGPFVFLISMFFMSTAWIADPLFNMVGLSPGYRSVAIQLVLISLCLIMVYTRKGTGILKDVGGSLLVWVLWLAYAAARTDFTNPDATLYFAKLGVVQFLSVLTLTAAYRSSPQEFDKYFPIVVVALGAILIGKVAFDPEIFIYASVVERVTIEGSNPIWVARSFAVAAICLLALNIQKPMIRYVGVAIFAAAIVPTGSRAPLLAFIVVMAFYLGARHWNRPDFTLRAMLFGAAIFLAGTFAWPYIVGSVEAFLSRGASVGALTESGRPMLFQRAMADFFSAPLFGVGLDRFGAGSAGMLASNVGVSYPHNILLEVLSGAGIVGLGLFILTFRFGRWLWQSQNLYFLLFVLSVLFSMSSGDLNANNGVIFFAVLSRLAHLKSSERIVNRPFATKQIYGALARRRA